MKKLTLFLGVFLLLTGCAKNEIIIYGSTENSTSGDGQQTGMVTLVTYSASVEGRNMTRAMSPMPKGIVSQVYAYNTGNNKSTDIVANGLYSTSTIGILTGVKGYKMYLSNGAYSLYAFSTSSSIPPPAFTNGMSAPLQNGIDYLWWENLDQDVTTSQVHVPIVFQHIATQVVLNISEGESLKLDSIVSATILPPKPGGSVHLQIGNIEPATAYDTTPFKMGVNGLLAQAIILPTTAILPMQLTLQVLADGEKTPRTYKANIPIPGKLSGGFSYVYSVVIDGNSVLFPDVSIKDWTVVDETGKPIYPSQK